MTSSSVATPPPSAVLTVDGAFQAATTEKKNNSSPPLQCETQGESLQPTIQQYSNVLPLEGPQQQRRRHVVAAGDHCPQLQDSALMMSSSSLYSNASWNGAGSSDGSQSAQPMYSPLTFDGGGGGTTEERQRSAAADYRHSLHATIDLASAAPNPSWFFCDPPNFTDTDHTKAYEASTSVSGREGVDSAALIFGPHHHHNLVDFSAYSSGTADADNAALTSLQNEINETDATRANEPSFQSSQVFAKSAADYCCAFQTSYEDSSSVLSVFGGASDNKYTTEPRDRRRQHKDDTNVFSDLGYATSSAGGSSTASTTASQQSNSNGRRRQLANGAATPANGQSAASRSLQVNPTESNKRRLRRSSSFSASSSAVSGSDRSGGISPSWNGSRNGSKSFSSSLSRFTLPDENGKRKIRHDIMSIAESLPALPGLYFDKKQKGFRVRYQNVYVGWVALSRFPSIEEAYCSARDIWENAKLHAEKFQTPHAAVMASLPLQKEAQASGKNRGGRPRTVTQLPPNPADWLTNAFLTQSQPSVQQSWASLPSDLSLHRNNLGLDLAALQMNSIPGLNPSSAGELEVNGEVYQDSHWTPPPGYVHSSSLLTPASTKASEASPPLSSPSYNLLGFVDAYDPTTLSGLNRDDSSGLNNSYSNLLLNGAVRDSPGSPRSTRGSNVFSQYSHANHVPQSICLLDDAASAAASGGPGCVIVGPASSSSLPSTMEAYANASGSSASPLCLTIGNESAAYASNIHHHHAPLQPSFVSSGPGAISLSKPVQEHSASSSSSSSFEQFEASKKRKRSWEEQQCSFESSCESSSSACTAIDAGTFAAATAKRRLSRDSAGGALAEDSVAPSSNPDGTESSSCNSLVNKSLETKKNGHVAAAAAELFNSCRESLAAVWDMVSGGEQDIEVPSQASGGGGYHHHRHSPSRAPNAASVQEEEAACFSPPIEAK